MKNRNIGFLITGIALVIGIIILIFNFGLKDIVSQTCSHGPECSMYGTIAIQTWISLAVALLVLFIGLFFIFTKESERIIEREKIVVKEIKEKKKKLDLSKLDNDERKVIEIIMNENGAIFQATLMEKLGIGKVGITRLLDKLEAKQLIERKRRGMNNIVVLRD